MIKMNIFCCPVCIENIKLDKNLSCSKCGFKIIKIENIFSLLPDQNQNKIEIEKAKSQGKTSWYVDEQVTALTGPYRHHIAKRRAYLSKIFSKYIMGKKDIVTLDLGCGDGVNLEFLEHFSHTVIGCDYNILRLSRAQRYITEKILMLFQADITKFPIRKPTFDLVFFNHVLEHIDDDRAALTTVKKLLKRDGVLVLGVPNEGAFFWQLAYKLQPKMRKLTDHKHFYKGDLLSELLKDIGFEIQEIKYIGYGLPHWRLDELFRNYKFFDDLFEFLFSRVMKKQATSLYFVCKLIN